MTRRRARLVAVLVVASGLLAGCAAGAPAPAPGTGGFAPAPDAVAVELDGVPRTMLVAGPDGMRGRTDFGGADGMLFDHGRTIDPGSVAWVMDGVPIALDIAWFDAGGRLVDRTTMQPCAAEPCPRFRPSRPYRWAVEAPVGTLSGLVPTSTLVVGP